MTVPPQITESQLKRQLWERGNLNFLLKGKQLDVKKALMSGVKHKDIHTVLCSRRFGKSFILCCWAIEICLRKKNAVVKYACPEMKQVQEILEDIFPVILATCPEHMKPVWKEQKKRWVFPNGSRISIASVNNNRADSLRGGKSDLSIVDEAGFVNKLGYVINSVLCPTIDTTGGNVVLASTPNYENPVHEFHTDYVIPLLERKELIKFTIYESPMVDAKRIERIIDRFPMGVDDPRFKCEYMCEIAVDMSTMVIPEFTDVVEKDVVCVSERPAFFDIYVGGDPAASDLTAILFGYYDYLRKTIVIEDEVILGGEGTTLTTQTIAESIIRKEKKLFTHPITHLPMSVFRRVMDYNQPILINDLWNDYQLRFHPTAKDNKELQVDRVRRMLAQGNIEINPRCVNLLYHIRTAKWKTNRDGVRKLEFRKVKGVGSGKKRLKAHHCDALDALIYLVRNVQLNKNPYPADYFELMGSDVFHANGYETKNQELEDFAKKLLNLKK